MTYIQFLCSKVRASTEDEKTLSKMAWAAFVHNMFAASPCGMHAYDVMAPLHVFRDIVH